MSSFYLISLPYYSVYLTFALELFLIDIFQHPRLVNLPNFHFRLKQKRSLVVRLQDVGNNLAL